MEERIILAKILVMLRGKKYDYEEIEKLAGQICYFRHKYNNIDWSFLDNIGKKSEEEVEKWLDFCIKNVYIW